MKICTKPAMAFVLIAQNYFLTATAMFVEKMPRCCWIVSKKLLTPIGLTSKTDFRRFWHYARRQTVISQIKFSKTS